MKNPLIAAMLVVAGTTVGSAAVAQPASPSVGPGAPGPAPMMQPHPAGGYLGVGIKEVPPGLAAHLPKSVAKGQGVLVVKVEPNSPAAKAGLQPYDVLLAYEDQKLVSPDQLTRLVANDEPGRMIKLQVLHDDKVRNLAVTIGQPPASVARGPHPMLLPPIPGAGEAPPFPPLFHKQDKGMDIWESFHSLNLEKLKDGRYKVALEYLDQEGKRQRLEVEGSREEIRNHVMQDKDLPEAERQQILNALDLRPPVFGPVWVPFDAHQFEQLWNAWPSLR